MEPGETLMERDEFIARKTLDGIEVNGRTCLEHYPLTDIFKGFECDLEKITILSLSACSLSKCELPNLVNLKNLDLSRNKFKEIPHCIYVNFPILKRLDFSHNFLKEFDVEPACCSNLKVLKLSDNNLYNLPQWIIAGVSKNLLEVNYSNNRMRDLKTTSKHQYSLERIEMRNSNLLDEDFIFFKKLPTLKHLDIGNLPHNELSNSSTENRFKDIDDLFVKPKFTKLETLKLNNLGISILSEGLFWVSSLVELSLNIGFITWIPAEIKYLTNLEILEISRNELCSLPEELALLKYLKVVKAASNKIGLLPKEPLKLEHLDLYQNYLEEVPEWMLPIARLDLERNLLNTADLSYSKEYEIKKVQLRQTLDDSYRTDGICEPMREREDAEKNYSSYSEEEDCSAKFATNLISSSNRENSKTEEENWDDEYDLGSIEKNSLISPSDDEWLGKEDIKKSQNVIKKSRQYVEDEDWLFCDAD